MDLIIVDTPVQSDVSGIVWSLDIEVPLYQCFSIFMRLWPGKFFFYKTGPNKFTRKYLSNFFKFIH
jgi:hypothetical protein